MAAEESQSSTPLPDYLLDPNAVTKDRGPWRHGHAPDYSNTRQVWAKGKNQNHTDGSIEFLVENLVKNWEIEASFKTEIDSWRTIDPQNYTFSVNGGPLQDAAHMLKVGTYNAIISPNAFYSGDHSDFDASHNTFKSMMPTFAWEVVEVYVGPPTAVFKWRHWGEMKNDYVGWSNKGDKIVLPATGRVLDIEGLAVARLNGQFKLTAIEIWFDPMEMFKQLSTKEEAAAAGAERGEIAVEVTHPAADASACPIASFTVGTQSPPA